MGHLLNGAWTFEETLIEQDKGRYVKRPSQFRDSVSADGSTGFKAEPGRYHLYSAKACPWAHRTEIVRALKSLQDIITLTDTEQDPDGQGWAFGEAGYVVPGTDRRVHYLHELYCLSEPGATTRVTVPVLWDAQTAKIVSNESSEIIRMFNTEFAAFVPASADLYPEALQDEIDQMNDFVLRRINNGVNECGRSTEQEAYRSAFEGLFAALDELDERLGTQRYLCGPAATEADWRLFPNLIRFDPVYYTGYRCNLRRIEDYPNLSNYLRDLYQTAGVSGTCDIEAMKRGAFGKAGPISANGVVPAGPLLDHTRPHDRARFDQAA